MKAVVLTLFLTAALSAQQPPAPIFVPARLVSANLPGLGGPNVVGAGEVRIEAVVALNGGLTHLVVVRTTPPFTQMVLDAVGGWRFTPARLRLDGKEQPVESSILISAIYRPPTLLPGPTLGEPPKDVAVATPNVAAPTLVVAPLYPLKAWNPAGAVLLFEVDVDESGRPRETRAIRSDPGFDTESRAALAQWRFRPASFKGRPVASTAYALFAFSLPVALGPTVGPKPPVSTPGTSFPFPPAGAAVPVQPAPPVTPVPSAPSKP
jgi:hypothetical protein